MKKTWKKLFGVMLVISMVISMIPFIAKEEVKAADVITTHDPKQIKALLEAEGDVHIMLDDTADYTINGLSQPAWCIVGPGEKILDLNGQEFEVHLDSLADGYMFKIPEGAKLTINDSSGNNAGKIHFEGRMYSPYLLDCDVCTYSNEYVLHRDGILVDGGELIYNGGVLEGGRSKEQWVTAALKDSLLTDKAFSWSMLLAEVPSAKLRTGYVRQQINCDGITIQSGNVTINGGEIQGRGYRDLRMVTENGTQVTFIDHRAAAIFMTGGKLTINNGSFYGKGCANVLDITSSVNSDNVTIRAGLFDTHRVDYVLIPCPDINDIGFRAFEPEFSAWWLGGQYGREGIPSFALDPDYVTVLKKGSELPSSEWNTSNLVETTNKIEVVPRDDITFTLYNETTGAAIDKHIDWDGKSDLYLSAEMPLYWSFDEIPYNGKAKTALVHYYIAYAFSSLELGSDAGISIGGMTVNEGGGGMAEEKSLSYYIWDSDTQILRFNLKDLVPDGLKTGDSFRVTVRFSDIIYNSTKDPSSVLTRRTSFTVTLKENDIQVTQQPKGQAVYTSGDYVTLTASAKNATGAFWEEVYPGSGSTADMAESFDPSTGTATLKVPVDSYAKYVCYFTNDMFMKKTNEATVTVVPEMKMGEGESKEVVWYNGTETVYLVCELSGPSASDGQRWYYRASTSDSWTLLSNVEGKMYPNYYGSTLVVKWPEESDAGYYRMELDFKTDTGVETIKSGEYHVTVMDAPAIMITEVYVNGLDDLFVGDPAPGKDDLWTNDSLVEILEVTWSGMTKDGQINAGVGMLKVKLGIVGYSAAFALDDSGNFTVHLGGSRREVINSIRDRNVVEVTYTYSPYNPLPVPTEKILVDSGTVFTIQAGSSFDVQLQYHVQESERPQTSEVSKVTGLRSDSSASGHLPSGLSLVQESDGTWHIKGTVSAEEPTGRLRSPIYFDTVDINGKTGMLVAVFTFMITPMIKTMRLPVDLSSLYHTHEFGEWQDAGDGFNHVHYCQNGDCTHEEAQAHSWDDGEVTTRETATTPGIITYTCEVCGAVRTEEIAPHTLVKVEAVESTCELKGCMTHFECEDCGMWFEDEAATIHIEDISTFSLPYAEHIWDEGKVTKPATETEAGEMTFTCTVCGKTKTEPVSSHIKVHFETNGGSAIADLSVPGGTKAEAPADPTKEGYTFSGWYEDAGFTKPFDFNTPILSDVTLYAKWFTYSIKGFGELTWAVGSTDGLEVTVKRSEANETGFSHFTGILLDGAALAPEDYTVTEGETVFTVKAEKLQTLEVGEHTITVNFDDGKAEAVLKIEEAEVVQPANTGRIILLSAIGVALAGAIAGLVLVILKKRKAEKPKES